ncbi:hypothetical protein [Cytobacillus praedii]|uniref:hypothetical protein n=1 Tax=Cytobacillus praedii TaxID=1742358 RepID=UPI002E1D9FC6|nr:hypothetical protein [Cytobacillus praedii]
MKELKGRIVEIVKNIHQVNYVTTGIGKKDQPYYNTRFGGSNGTYVTGSEYYGTTIDMKVFVYDINKCVTFDIRDLILHANQKSKVSSKLLNYVIEKNQRKKIDLLYHDNQITFLPEQLNVIPQKK